MNESASANGGRHGGAPGSSPAPGKIAAELQRGHYVSDRTFDRLFPDDLRAVSSLYWTPLVVAARAAEWLDKQGVRNVVDVGSGVGKFCVAAALAGRCRFTGIEHRPRLVEAARDLARCLEVEDRVRFLESEFGVHSVPNAEAYYLYNPFGENVSCDENHLDEDVELGIDRYQRDIAAARELMRLAPRGTYIITYNGFGGRVPESYVEVCVDRELPSVLRMWCKA